MEHRNITYTKEDGVATIVFNRPDRLNTLTGPMNREICAAIENAEVVPHDQLAPRARTLAKTVAKGPCVAQQLTKGLIYRQLRIDFDSAVQDYITSQQVCESSVDFHEGLQAFREKRQPSFQGS